MDHLAIVSEANLAPSVHNTQPTRWSFEQEHVSLSLDRERLLTVGDPKLRDARLSLGAALEGTEIALNTVGKGLRGITLGQGIEGASAEITMAEAPDPDIALVPLRQTWRGVFAAIADTGPLVQELSIRGDAIWVPQGPHLEALAEENDGASLKFFRNQKYRAELINWMRLTRSHEKFNQDGLAFPALGMTALEAKAARVLLRRPVFEILSGIGLAKPLISEHAKTLTASGAVLFHRPVEEDPVASGRAFYRMWLALTRHGGVAWPMAVLADHPETNKAICKRAGLSDNRRLINVLRVGALPQGQIIPMRARCDATELVISNA